MEFKTRPFGVDPIFGPIYVTTLPGNSWYVIDAGWLVNIVFVRSHGIGWESEPFPLVYVCVCVRARACVHACVCVRARVRACMCVCVYTVSVRALCYYSSIWSTVAALHHLMP